MSGVRRGAAVAYKYLIALFVVAVVVQIFLAGLGIFRALPEEGESVTSDSFDDKFEPHAALGFFLLLGSLLLLILILVAWTGPKSIWATAGLFILLIVQMILVWFSEDAPAISALHPVNAVVILALSGFLASRAWRGNLLVPPRDLAARETPPTAPV